MKRAISSCKILFNLIVVLLIAVSSQGQNEQLIIGRTTGSLVVNATDTIRYFGFSNSLSGQITLPGTIVETLQGDVVAIDFWNISQGAPHSFTIAGMQLEQADETNAYSEKMTPIRHMEHGLYRFQSNRVGTFIYHDAENTRFNLQAGLFGLLIVRAKETQEIERSPREVIWCSHELDTVWHSSKWMDFDNSEPDQTMNYPAYAPDFFLLNGIEIDKQAGLEFDPTSDSNEVLIRLANVGLLDHILQFPPELSVRYVSGNEKCISTAEKGTKITLSTLENIDVLVSVKSYHRKSVIRFQFRDPKTGKLCYSRKLPIYSSNKQMPL